MNYIKTEIIEHVLIVRINRPKALNALNRELILEIGKVLKENINNKQIIGVIITGEGEKAFAAGADIKGFPDLDATTGSELAREGQEVFNYIEAYPKTVIAAVNGYALGGGCELTMACHLRVASDHAIFGQPEVNLGLIPGYGGTQRLVQLIGKGKALEYLLTANNIPAEEAHRLGLANAVVKQEELLNHSIQMIKRISRKGPQAVSTIIECVNANFNKNVDGFELEIERFGERMASDECKEGVQAFLEKRKPDFSKT